MTPASAERIRKLDAFFRARVVQLDLRFKDTGHIRPHGSGLLFAVAEELFLVTAGHVVKDIDVNPLNQLVVKNFHTRMHFGLGLRGWRTEVGDVGIVHVPTSLRDRFRGFEVLRSSDLAPWPLDGDEVFVVTGFPDELATTTQRQLVAFPARQSDETAVDPGGYEPKATLFLSLEPASLVAVEPDGVRFPDRLKGMSGGPVWVLDERRNSSAKLIGVETSVYERRLIRVTAFHVVIEHLRREDPSLHRALALND